ncbi:MAG: tetraacyldisaccharide 4'-kinase [Dokdonia donghaensis]|jgi:tetraacyldisaccharide 4'-kinase
MRKLRLLLFPFAGVYYLVTLTRNKLFNAGILSSKKYDLPVICIGNLSVGGTGKSPMTEYVIRLLQAHKRVATLSRGYGRTTKGYRDVLPTSLATEVGDEPLQFAQKFDAIQVAICEDRQVGISRLLGKENMPEVILLDDAYQHRKVTPGFSILLTAYGDLYSNDYLLPAGNLREPRSGASRADVVVVTKCPSQLSKVEQENIIRELKTTAAQEVFFTKIAYGDCVYGANGNVQLHSLKVHNVTLVTGIANPEPLVNYLTSDGLSFNHKSYGDHHNFSASEIVELEKLDCILTTEKDYVRLRPLLTMRHLYYLPIKVAFLNHSENFDRRITHFINAYNVK